MSSLGRTAKKLLDRVRKVKSVFARRKEKEKPGHLRPLSTTARTFRPTPPPRITYGDIFTAFALSYFESMGRSLAKSFELDKVLSKAGLAIHPVKYGARLIAVTVLAAVFTVVLFTVTALSLHLTPIQLVIGIMIAVLTPIMVFTAGLAYPYVLTTLRRSNVENELPFFMAYVATMVRGGYSLEKVIERVSQLKVFKAIRDETRRVVTRVKMFGDDPITALEKVASAHPSSKFRDIMLGYATTLRSGGDVLHYLEIRTRELFEARATEVRNILNRLMSFLEVYIIFGVVVSVTLFVFFAVNAAISAAQAARAPGELASVNIDVTMPSIYNFFVLPVMGVAIAMTIHINQPRTPIGYTETYLTLLTWLPISVAISVVVLVITGGMRALEGEVGLGEIKSIIFALAAGLVTVSLPPALKYRSIVRMRKGLVSATADFLRDISEIRKTGLSPEKCIILVSNRSYRTLTPIVERAAAALSIGLSLEESLRKALKGVKEWFVVASFRFLTDSIVVGGGSPEVIDTLARFVQVLSELEEETRRRMRTQVVLPYFGAVMLASIPLIILYMLLTIARVSIASVSPLVFVLSVGSLINSYIMGIIAGKASQATVAAGFIHAAILTLFTAAVLTATLTYIGA